jgi:hypothetical protein
MITNYLFLNRELLDEVHFTLGSILVVVQNRGDAVNFYNELLMLQNKDTVAMCSNSGLWVASKANKITVKSIKDPAFSESIRGAQYTHIFTVGTMYQEDVALLQASLLWRGNYK